MAEKVTVMVLKVDLQCPCCYKKVKKILCKFPQIRDQVFDEKGNKVTITVVCCSPEKVRDKLCYKGSRVIKSIEIKKPPKPKEPEKVTGEKPKESEKSKHVTFEIPKGNVAHPPEKHKETPKPGPPKNPGPDPGPPNPGPPKMPDPIMFPVSSEGYAPAFPMQPCCEPYYEGYGGGPCYQGYGVPPPPQPCYGGYYGYNNEYHGKGTHVTRCDYYLSEENPQGCSIMCWVMIIVIVVICCWTSFGT